MKLKERIKTYNFWVSLSSAIFLIIKVLGNQIGFNVDESIFSDLITSICSILVLLGIIVPPTKSENKNNTQTQENSKNTSQISSIEEINESTDLADKYINIQSDKTNQEETTLEETTENNIIEPTDRIVCDSLLSDNKIADISLETENINIENIDDIVFDETQSHNDAKNNLQYQFKLNKEIFANNIEEYIKLLEIELESIKNK